MKYLLVSLFNFVRKGYHFFHKKIPEKIQGHFIIIQLAAELDVHLAVQLLHY